MQPSAWAAPASGGAPDAYELTWEGGDLEVPASQTRATVDGLRNGREYVVSVTAVNAAGESRAARSNPVVPTSDVPAVVEGVRAEPGNQQATVSWNQLPDDDIVHYVIESSVANPGGSPPTASRCK